MLVGRQSSYIVLAIVYERQSWQTKDKRPQRSNVNVKNLWQNSQYLWNIVFSVLEEVFEFCWSSLADEHNTTKIDQRTNLYLELHDYRIYYVNIDLRHQYAIFATQSQTFLLAKRPQLRRARRNGCFRRLLCDYDWKCAWNLAFPVFISPIVWNMCENLHYESVYFKELHNEQEYYWLTIQSGGSCSVNYYISKWF